MVITSLAPGVYARADGSMKRAASVTERNITALRSLYWVLVLSGLFEPVLYLFSIGYGVGALIGRPITTDSGQVVSYAAFVAPAMLASSAMAGALAEATFNFFAKMKFSKQYDAILATPVRAMEIAFGELMWAMARGALYSGAFLVIMVAMGLTSAVWAVAAFGAALLVGFAFGSVGMALSTFMKSWQDFDIFVTVQVALFLFSGTFTPLHNISSPVLRGVAQLSPLYQSVALTRSLTLADLNPGMLVNIGYLVVMSAIGLAVASRRMNKLLLK